VSSRTQATGPAAPVDDEDASLEASFVGGGDVRQWALAWRADTSLAHCASVAWDARDVQLVTTSEGNVGQHVSSAMQSLGNDASTVGLAITSLPFGAFPHAHVRRESGRSEKRRSFMGKR
jgi:hypothetical protein